jgi:hypothetical protein
MVCLDKVDKAAVVPVVEQIRQEITQQQVV